MEQVVTKVVLDQMNPMKVAVQISSVQCASTVYSHIEKRKETRMWYPMPTFPTAPPRCTYMHEGASHTYLRVHADTKLPSPSCAHQDLSLDGPEDKKEKKKKKKTSTKETERELREETERIKAERQEENAARRQASLDKVPLPLGLLPPIFPRRNLLTSLPTFPTKTSLITRISSPRPFLFLFSLPPTTHAPAFLRMNENRTFAVM